MFSYENFIRAYISRKKSKQSPKRRLLSLNSSISEFLDKKKIIFNSTDLSSTQDYSDTLTLFPKVPQLPFVRFPQKKLFHRRSQSIDYSTTAHKEKRVFLKKNLQNTQKNDLNGHPSFMSEGLTFVKVSSLNTRYHSNQDYIMESLEKAKKYFPIPFDRKQLRTSSMSISHTPMSRLYSPQNFSTRKKNFKENFKTETVSNSKKKFEIQGQSALKQIKITDKKTMKKGDLYDYLIVFFEKLEIYTKKFEEIDKANKGYIVLEDLKRVTENTSVSPQRLYNLLFSISKRLKISKNDFLALCAVYQHNFGDVSKFSLANEKIICKLEKQIDELRKIFELHAKNNKITKQYLEGLSKFLQPTEDVLKSESVIITEIIDFSWFLRCIPYFLYVHLEILNKTFL